MKKETIEKFINEYVGTNLAEAIANILEQEKNIKCDINGIKQQENLYKKEYDEKMAINKQTLSQIQSECPHLETTYYGDAAGGSSSFTECDWCGQTRKGNQKTFK